MAPITLERIGHVHRDARGHLGAALDRRTACARPRGRRPASKSLSIARTVPRVLRARRSCSRSAASGATSSACSACSIAAHPWLHHTAASELRITARRLEAGSTGTSSRARYRSSSAPERPIPRRPSTQPSRWQCGGRRARQPRRGRDRRGRAPDPGPRAQAGADSPLQAASRSTPGCRHRGRRPTSPVRARGCRASSANAETDAACRRPPPRTRGLAAHRGAAYQC